MHKTDLPIEELHVADKMSFVYDFLRQHTLAVLATANLGNQPEAAVIEFSELPTLEVVFDTYSIFRKYSNLLSNPCVALAVGWERDATLQYEGRALELSAPDLEACRAVHLRKFPDAIRFEQFAGMRYFKIIPKWIRYTELSCFPWRRFELQFD